MIQGAGSPLSIVLIGHLKLRIDLRRPTLEGIQGAEHAYFDWLLTHCIKADIVPTDVFTKEAFTFLTE